jgi:hypothetical protein
MSTPDDFQEVQPQKQGMSSTAKVLLILGSIAGVCLLVCCGGLAFVGWKFQNLANIATDPAVVRERTEEIIHIDIPADYVPTHAMKFDWMNVKMKQVGYRHKGSPNSMLMIMETAEPMHGATPKQQRDQIRQALRQQGQQPGQINDEINEQSSEIREFTINGETVPFEFIKGTAPGGGTPTRQVVGIFRGREGTVMLMLMAPESDYDDAAVVKMIESVRLPGGDSDSEEVEMPTEKQAGDAAASTEQNAGGESSPESSP